MKGPSEPVGRSGVNNQASEVNNSAPENTISKKADIHGYQQNEAFGQISPGGVSPRIGPRNNPKARDDPVNLVTTS